MQIQKLPFFQYTPTGLLELDFLPPVVWVMGYWSGPLILCILITTQNDWSPTGIIWADFVSVVSWRIFSLHDQVQLFWCRICKPNGADFNAHCMIQI